MAAPRGAREPPAQRVPRWASVDSCAPMSPSRSQCLDDSSAHAPPPRRLRCLSCNCGTSDHTLIRLSLAANRKVNNSQSLTPEQKAAIISGLTLYFSGNHANLTGEELAQVWGVNVSTIAAILNSTAFQLVRPAGLHGHQMFASSPPGLLDALCPVFL
jgi:hypothetical protein